MMQHTERESRRAQDNREELLERMARGIREDGRIEALKGLFLNRSSVAREAIYGVMGPCFCVIAQGSKEICLGEERFQYDPYHYIIASLEVPVVIQVLEADPESPYLGLRLNIDPVLVGSVLVEMGQVSPKGQGDAKAINVSPLDAGLLDAVVRLLRLIESPADARLLQPLITREILYRLLAGEQGSRLRQTTLMGGQIHRIAQAVETLCRNFHRPQRMEDIAHDLGMSVSSFHHYFKTVTAMSPLQFQKQLRLQEARRLMLGEHLDAASAGYRVGYEDASHFNRDYKRFFGAPPMRDLERLREAAEGS